MIILSLENQEVKIEAGELVSYTVGGYQIIHQKGNPGWRNADAEMFPIIGPTNKAGFKVQTPKGASIQDQHGLLRELEYKLVESSKLEAVFSKEYKKESGVVNSKYPKKSTAETLSWPYDFSFSKVFTLSKKGLEVTFVINGEQDMPYMLGYHPAFMLRTSANVKTATKNISLNDIKAVGSRAYEVKNCNTIELQDEKNVVISTEGFEHFMLWTEVDNMVCIEPITFYPYAVGQEDLHAGFKVVNGKDIPYKVQISLL